jgi:hypothetical protein
MGEILNAIQAHFLSATTVYDASRITHGVMDLLYAVRGGLRREDVRQERLERGEYRPEDWDDNAPAL